MPAVVWIAAGAHEGPGIVVDGSGLIGTCLDVIEGEPKIRVSLDGAWDAYPVTAIEGYDRSHDLALVRIAPGHPLPAAHLASRDTLTAGERVYDLRRAGAVAGTIADVRPLSTELTVFSLLVPDPRAWRGPLFDDRGDVVGLVAAYIAQLPYRVIAVPADYLRPMIDHPLELSPADFAAKTAGLPR